MCVSDPRRPRVMRSCPQGPLKRDLRIYSRVRTFLRDADAVRRSERPHRYTDIARCTRVPRGQRRRARRRRLAREPGEPKSAPGQQLPGDASGSLRTHADEERTWEVGQLHSAC